MQTKKKCSVETCTYPLFAKGYCASHYKTLYLYPKMNELDAERKAKGLKRPKVRHIKKDVEQIGDKLVRKAPTKPTKLNKYSRKRTKFINTEKEKDPRKQIYCIFCQQPITGNPDLHHLFGRDGSLLLDDTKWGLSHRKCHANYHDISWSKLKWWSSYLERIKNIYPELYNKEIIKMGK